MSPRILIIEDEEKIARFVELELSHEGYTVTKAFDGRTGLELAETGQFDLIILDILLPQLSGMEVLRRIRRTSSVPIIMLTARDSVVDKVSGLDSGADDYIIKPFSLDVVIAKINANIRRAYGDYSNLNKERSLSLKDLTLHCESLVLKNKDKEIRLSNKETELLALFIENYPKVITREELLRSLWDDEIFVEENTLNVNITRIRKRLLEVEVASPDERMPYAPELWVYEVYPSLYMIAVPWIP